MDRRQALVFGVTGAELDMVRTDWYLGAATAPAAKMWRGGQGNDEAPLFTPTPTIDATSLAITADAGYSQSDRRKVVVASVGPPVSTAGLSVGTPYYLENPDGQRELVRFRRIVSGQFLETEQDLAYDYPASPVASLIVGLRMSFVIDPTFIATVSNVNLRNWYRQRFDEEEFLSLDNALPYKVLWSYTLAGLPRRHWTYFDVVRSPFQTGVTGDDLADLWPDVLEAEPRQTRGQKYQRFITAAMRRVTFDLRTADVDPNQIAEGETLDEIVRACAIMLIAESGRSPPGRDVENFIRERAGLYLRLRDKAIDGAKLVQSQNTDGSLTREPIPPRWFRS